MTDAINTHIIENHILDYPESQWWQSSWFLNFQKSCVSKNFWVSELEKYNCKYIVDNYGMHYLIFKSTEDYLEFRIIWA